MELFEKGGERAPTASQLKGQTSREQTAVLSTPSPTAHSLVAPSLERNS